MLPVNFAMRRLLSCGACLGLILLAGCSSQQSGTKVTSAENPNPASKAARPAMVADTSLVGRVVRFNSVGRYAILQFPPGLMATNGAVLFVYREGRRVGQLSVNGESRDDRTAADLEDGSCQPGDEVRDR